MRAPLASERADARSCRRRRRAREHLALKQLANCSLVSPALSGNLGAGT